MVISLLLRLMKLWPLCQSQTLADSSVTNPSPWPQWIWTKVSGSSGSPRLGLRDASRKRPICLCDCLHIMTICPSGRSIFQKCRWILPWRTGNFCVVEAYFRLKGKGCVGFDDDIYDIFIRFLFETAESAAMIHYWRTIIWHELYMLLLATTINLVQICKP